MSRHHEALLSCSQAPTLLHHQEPSLQQLIPGLELVQEQEQGVTMIHGEPQHLQCSQKCHQRNVSEMMKMMLIVILLFQLIHSLLTITAMI